MPPLPGRETAIGLAYSAGIRDLLHAEPGLVDYVEVPFEMLLHDPGAADGLDPPVILHCASLSVAGNAPPGADLVAKLREWIGRTGTPWLGEHLAFLSMLGGEGALDGEPLFQPAAEVANVPRYDVTYTVSPQYSLEILERVIGALNRWECELSCALLLENGPVYFETPGSSMSQAEFISLLCRRRPETRLLLDLAHLACTAANSGADPETLLESLPLEHVVEVHLSGASAEAGTMWDDHAAPIPPLIFALLDRLLRRVRPRAATIEYNWDPDFPRDIVRSDLARLRGAIAAPALAA